MIDIGYHYSKGSPLPGTDLNCYRSGEDAGGNTGMEKNIHNNSYWKFVVLQAFLDHLIMREEGVHLMVILQMMVIALNLELLKDPHPDAQLLVHLQLLHHHQHHHLLHQHRILNLRLLLHLPHHLPHHLHNHFLSLLTIHLELMEQERCLYDSDVLCVC